MVVKDSTRQGAIDTNAIPQHYMLPTNVMSTTNEESELAIIKGLRTGKITI